MTDSPDTVDFTTAAIYAESYNQVSPNSATSFHPLIVPGMIIMWYGSSAQIPDGWAICQQNQNGTATYDGTNLIPDLTDSFVVGRGNQTAAPYSGDAAKVSLTGTASAESGGSHSHRFPSDWDSVMVVGHVFGSSKKVVDDNKAFVDHSSVRTHSNGSHSHSITDWSALDGTITQASNHGTEFEPPWFGLFYLVKLA